MKREYGVETVTGKPQVAYRETITEKTAYEYTHKKQSGGAGQYAKVCGFLEPLLQGVGASLVVSKHSGASNEFVNATVGASIPPQFLPACVKGFDDSINKVRPLAR
jgi:elongation factor G